MQQALISSAIKTKRWPNAVLILVRRLRRWPNNKTTLSQGFVFAGVTYNTTAVGMRRLISV